MTENNKTLSGRGGKREGAGRPFAEKPKKMFSFRLSEEEEKAVRELLAKMRGKLIILFCLLSLCLPSYATIEDNIQYNQETIQQEAFQGIYKHCPFPDKDSFMYSMYQYNLDEVNILSKQDMGKNLISVIYKNYPDFAYTYKIVKKNAYNTLGGYSCQSVSINYGNKVATYHAPTGKLLGVKLILSPDEEYMLDMNGNIIGHRQGNTLQKAKVNLRNMHKAIYSGQ